MNVNWLETTSDVIRLEGQGLVPTQSGLPHQREVQVHEQCYLILDMLYKSAARPMYEL